MSTRYDVQTITALGAAPNGIGIVGGNSAVNTPSLDTYAEWNPIANPGWPGGYSTGIKFGFGIIPWPTDRDFIVSVHAYAVSIRLSGPGAGAPHAPWEFDPNPAYNIDNRSIGGGLIDAAGNGARPPSLQLQLHSDFAAQPAYTSSSDIVTLADGFGGPFGGPFDETTSMYVGTNGGFVNGYYFYYRIYELWLEVSDLGSDSGGSRTNKLDVFTSGFIGEFVEPGFGVTPPAPFYGPPITVTSSLDTRDNAFDALAVAGWADGTILQVFTYPTPGFSLSRRDDPGAKKTFVVLPGLEFYGNVISLVEDRVKNTVLILYDRYDDTDPNTGNIYLYEISANGTIARDEIISTFYWDERNGELDYQWGPNTGGVWGRVLTSGADGGQNVIDGPGYCETLTTLDLDSGERHLLGSFNNPDGLPFDNLLSNEPTDYLGPDAPDVPGGGGGPWNAFPNCMCVDPRDGTYWFTLEYGSYLETNWRDVYAEGGSFSAELAVVHTDRDGAKLDTFMFMADGDGYNLLNEPKTIMVTSEGMVYVTMTMNALVYEDLSLGGFGNDYDEWDGVWAFDPAATYPLGLNDNKLVTVNPWEENYAFPTGIWNTGTWIHRAMRSGTAPLRMNQRDDGLGKVAGHARLNKAIGPNRASSLQLGNRLIKANPLGYS